ncbi:Sua5/YciO/YrdC/YwlC family protein [Opisthorchis viverrini]|uniref:Threonylcarbamoyl-AMP synthase n=1 Tax=Opisthorchis viverrini TaxID=6198 RepID=A0A1S8WIJ6_OPIVI|nr:Sua5/YciO/YrdC/YwlC family protein [Opisthorchis viverrini]
MLKVLFNRLDIRRLWGADKPGQTSSAEMRSEDSLTTSELVTEEDGDGSKSHFILEIRRSPRNELMNPHWLSLSKIPRIFCARQHNYISSTMTDKIISLSEAAAQLPQIVQLLRSGAVVAVPTDTIYGVSCSVHCEQAIKRIHQLKGRPMNKPMAICLDEVDSIPYWCDTTGLPQGLLNSLLPGPVTLLLPKHSCDPLNAHLNPDAHLVGVRVTDHGFVRDLCATMGRLETNGFRSVGHPLVLTSANLSGNASALRIEHSPVLNCQSAYFPTLCCIEEGVSSVTHWSIIS